MSNKEMKDGLQEDTSGVSDENTGIEEEINATMDKIIAPPETDEDEMDDLGDYDDSAEEEPDPQPEDIIANLPDQVRLYMFR